MIRFEVKQKPIYVDAYEVIEVEDKAHDELGNYRMVIVDGDPAVREKFKVRVLESDSGPPVKIGDFVRYDVNYDEYRRIEPETLEQNPKLTRVF